jgi:HPt (histidine-containing phosphotransfer) domain-containing protein
MIDEIRQRFMQRFMDTAERRLARALEHLGAESDPSIVRHELHSLAGEASLLGLPEIAEAAHLAELVAQKWLDTGSLVVQADCAHKVKQLGRELRALTPGGGVTPARSDEPGAGT